MVFRALYNIAKRVAILSFLFIILLLPYSCTSRTHYEDKSGENNARIFEDSFITIQRSTEVLGDELMISHIVNKKMDFSQENFSINDISDQVEGMIIKDSFSYFACDYREYWYKAFSDVPSGLRNLQKCPSYQIIYYYPIKNLKNRIVIRTNLNFSVIGTNHSIRNIDTLIKNTTYHIPQP